MDYPNKDQRWVFHEKTEAQETAPGVVRRVLAYCDNVMCVENTFKKGSIGAMHNHPHTQITYVASGKFEFTIDGEVHTVSKGDTLLQQRIPFTDGEVHTVSKGDTLLKQDGVMHGCTCLEDGILIDIFTPMREDFL